MVSALAKLLRDKSTDGGLSSHGGTVEIDEVKLSLCLKPIADKSVLTRRPSGRIWFGRLSKSLVNRSSKAQFRAGLLIFEHILSEYCDASRLLRSSMGISFASTCKLVAGDVRNAPKQRRSAWFWMGSSIRRYDFLAEPYTSHRHHIQCYLHRCARLIGYMQSIQVFLYFLLS